MNICSAGNLFVSCNDKIVEVKLMCQSVKPLCLMASGCSDPNRILQNSWLNFGNSAVFWRNVILVIFVIFELGPDSESLCNALPSESISCGIRAFFHPKNCL